MSAEASQAPERGARRMAAVILEVLAGLRSASQASEVLDLSLPRYYVLERRAVSGMVEALGPRPRGRPRSDEERARHLSAEVERLQGEVVRLESLHRLSQRAIGVPAEAPRPALGARGVRQRSRSRAKPRAGKVLARLRAGEAQDLAPSRAAQAESKPAAMRGASDG